MAEVKKVVNKMDIDLLFAKLEDLRDNTRVPANKEVTFDRGVWAPWVDNQSDLEHKSIIIAGSNSETAVGFCIFEHGGRLYTRTDFQKKSELTGTSSGDVALIIEDHKIRGEAA